MRKKKIPTKSDTEVKPGAANRTRASSRIKLLTCVIGKTIHQTISPPESVHTLRRSFGITKYVRILLQRCDSKSMTVRSDGKSTIASSSPKKKLSIIKRLQMKNQTRLKRKHRPIYSSLRCKRRKTSVGVNSPQAAKKLRILYNSLKRQTSSHCQENVQQRNTAEFESSDHIEKKLSVIDDCDDSNGASKLLSGVDDCDSSNDTSKSQSITMIHNYAKGFSGESDNKKCEENQASTVQICSKCGKGFDVMSFVNNNQRLVARIRDDDSLQYATPSYHFTLDHKTFKDLSVCSTAKSMYETYDENIAMGIVTRKYIHCSKCPMMYYQFSDLQRHYRAHLSMNSVSKICIFCFLVFRSKTNLRMHVEAIHAGDKITISNSHFEDQVIYPTNSHPESLQDTYYVTTSKLDLSIKDAPRGFVVKVPRIETGAGNTDHHTMSINGYSTYKINMRNDVVADMDSAEELSESDITTCYAHCYPEDEHNYAFNPTDDMDQGIIDCSSSTPQRRKKPSFSDDYVDEDLFSPERIPDISHVEEVSLNNSEEEEDYCISLSPDVVMNICHEGSESAAYKMLAGNVPVSYGNPSNKIQLLNPLSFQRFLNENKNTNFHMRHSVTSAKQSGHPNPCPLLLLKPVNQDKLYIGVVDSKSQPDNKMTFYDVNNPSTNKLICPKCNVRFLSYERLKYHTCGKVFCKLPCDKCGLAFYTKERLLNHQLRPCVQNELFQCQLCFKPFPDRGALGVHLVYHSKIKCYHCDKYFLSKTSLHQHIDSENKKKLANVKNLVKVKKGKSSLKVKKTVSVNSPSNSVLEENQGVIKFPCNKCKHCKLAFRTALDLEKHVARIHPNAQTIILYSGGISRAQPTVHSEGSGIKMTLPSRFGSLEIARNTTVTCEAKNDENLLCNFKSFPSSVSLNYDYNVSERDETKSNASLLDLKRPDHKAGDDIKSHNSGLELKSPDHKPADDLVLDLKGPDHTSETVTVTKNLETLPVTKICIPCSITLTRIDISESKAEQSTQVSVSKRRVPRKVESSLKLSSTEAVVSSCLRNDNLYYCGMCDSNSETLTTFNEHRRTSHPVTARLKCDLCPAIFRHRSMLRNHVRTHSCDDVVMCSICSWPFKDLNNLMSHFLVSHSRLCKRKPRRHTCKLSSKPQVHNSRPVVLHTCTVCKFSYLSNH